MTDRDPAEEREQVGDEMSSRLASRFDDTDKEAPGNANEQTEIENKSKTFKPSKVEEVVESEQKSVKDRPSVLMYLPEELHSDLDIRFDELNAQYKREYGEALKKSGLLPGGHQSWLRRKRHQRDLRPLSDTGSLDDSRYD